MSADTTRIEAARAFRTGYRQQQLGRTKHAVHHYRRSIELLPTAEAYTYLGWAYSHLGQYGRAINACRQAISLDPTLGNPYNDIGAYLIELGRAEEAVGWLQKALEAPRYETYCYPHFNLGRANELLGSPDAAARSYRRALDVDPTFMPARLALQRLGGPVGSSGGG